MRTKASQHQQQQELQPLRQLTRRLLSPLQPIHLRQLSRQQSGRPRIPSVAVGKRPQQPSRQVAIGDLSGRLRLQVTVKPSLVSPSMEAMERLSIAVQMPLSLLARRLQIAQKSILALEAFTSRSTQGYL